MMQKKMMSPVVDAASSQQQSQSVALGASLFTLLFVGGQVALLDVRGAVDSEEARAIAHQAIKTCSYSVVDGDQTQGRAAYFYYWHTREAQEMHPHPGRTLNTEQGAKP